MSGIFLVICYYIHSLLQSTSLLFLLLPTLSTPVHTEYGVHSMYVHAYESTKKWSPPYSLEECIYIHSTYKIIPREWHKRRMYTLHVCTYSEYVLSPLARTSNGWRSQRKKRDREREEVINSRVWYKKQEEKELLIRCFQN